jgi:two-component system OmpR family sensor kinase/two-component system sensor histidine kinase BaeS
MAFVMMLMFVAGVMALLARFFTHFFGGDSEITLLVLVGGCSLFLALPVLAMGISWTIFQRMATPVAQVMAVTDAVAEGDLSARMETKSGGRFGQLSRSFNNMVAELERTYEQRRQLTADIAHELRTPLHIIQGNLEGILDGVYQPTEEHIQNTLEETQMLARLVEDLGTLSLAESGQLPLAFETVDIAELLTDVQTSFSGQADNQGIDIQVRMLSQSPLSVQGDIMRLVQMLGNLVSNAIRHTPSGGTITLTASEQQGAVCLEVEDTGEGIAGEDLPHVFGRFWRGDHARTHAAGIGAGLGLAIAQQLAHAHGGTISVESTLGVGTTFTILLPDKPAG